MTRAVLFPSDEALLAAINAQLVPPALAATGARSFRSADGGVGICPGRAIPKNLARELARVGAKLVEAPSMAATEPQVCWAAAIMPRPATPPNLAGADRCALFATTDDQSLLDLLGELVRLGCQRIDFQLLDQVDRAGEPVGRLGSGRALVRAFDPPFYTLALAGEPWAPRAELARKPRYRVFAADPGTERVWLELGYRHPLASKLLTPPDRLLLIDGDGQWWLVPAAPWRDAFELIDLEVSGPIAGHRAGSADRRLSIRLRLTRGRRDQPASMWVFRDGAVDAVEELISGLPETVLGQLVFAVIPGATPDQPVVLLRARPRRSGPPAIETRGEGLAPLAQVGNLYAPAGVRLEPPLRTETLRELLAPDPDRLYWLTAEPSGFRVDSVAEPGFVPLGDWVDYVLDREGDQIEAWVRSTRFALPAFRLPPREDPEVSTADTSRRWRRYRGGGGGAREPVVAPIAHVELPAPVASEPAEVARQLAALERRFLDTALPLDHPDRTPMWRQMADLHAAAGNSRDAAICRSRSLWELPRSGLDQADPEAGLVDAPGLAEVAAVVATWLAGTPNHPAAQAIPWLDQHDGDLDVRSIWLVRLALSRAVGGDALGLARTRDRLLARMRHGLSLERDVPTFLRFASPDHGSDTVAATELAGELEQLLVLYQTTPRQRSAQEAPEAKTAILVRLELAFGLAILGRVDRARELCAEAVVRPPRDAIDRFVIAAYQCRIDQALAGTRRGSGLSPEVAAMLNQLGTFERYKVDRLRAASSVLEPHERLDPMLAFRRGDRDPRGEEFIVLRGSTSSRELATGLRSLLDVAGQSATSIEDRARLVDGIFDLLLELPAVDAVPLLEAGAATCVAVPPPRRALLLEEAIEVAGFFGKSALARGFAEQLAGTLDELSSEQGIELAVELSSGSRALRRVGLSELGVTLLGRLDQLLDGDSVAAEEARTHVAAGLAFLGDTTAVTTLTRVAALAHDGAVPAAERLRIIRALAVAWGHTPRERALAGLRDLATLLPGITDSYNTNSHFCLSVVSFIDALVLGFATSDLAMGDVARRFLDEDEVLVRRRIHRDLEEM